MWRDHEVTLRLAFALLDLPWGVKSAEKIEGYLRDLPHTYPLAKEYVRLFRGPVRPEVYPYESLHCDEEVMGPATQAVLELYREAGLGVSQDFRDLPDHISAELEFMGYLCVKASECLDNGDESGNLHFGRLRRSFVDDHLLKWLPRFTESIIRKTVSPLYRDLAVATREFLLSREGTGRDPVFSASPGLRQTRGETV